MEFFTDEEMACGCKRPECEAKPMQIGIMMKAVAIRRELGPMTINSARRCEFWNRHEGGTDHSQHLEGRAMDVHCPDGYYLRRLIELAIKHGLSFGVKNAHTLHMDDRPGRPLTFAYP